MGLRGVRDVRVDLDDDRFDVNYDAASVQTDALLAAIRRLDYEPVLVERASAAAAITKHKIEMADLPAHLAELFAAARRSKKPVLLQFSGPG